MSHFCSSSLTTDYIKICFPTKPFVIISRFQTTPYWIFMNYSRKVEASRFKKPNSINLWNAVGLSVQEYLIQTLVNH